jgi:hypothetical protein
LYIIISYLFTKYTPQFRRTRVRLNDIQLANTSDLEHTSSTIIQTKSTQRKAKQSTMSSPAVNKAPPPKLGPKTGTPSKARKDSASSAASKPSATESPKSTKKPTPRKLSQKAPEPIEDDVEEQSIPETPSPKSAKKPKSEQRRPASPPDDAASQAPSATGSAAPLGRSTSGLSGKAKDVAGQTKETAEGGAETVKDTAEQGAETVKDKAEQGAETVKDKAEQGAETVEDTAEQGAETVEDTAESAADKLPLDLSALKGLEVAEGGNILGEDGNPIGQVVEGDPEDLVGHTVGDDGEILDEEGDLIGRVDILHDVAEQAKDTADDAQSKAGEVDFENLVTDLAQLEGLPVSDGGVIKNAADQVVGKIVEGDPEDLVGFTLNEDGEVVDEDGDAIGRVDLVPVEEQKKAIEEAAGAATEEVGGAKDDVEQYEDAQDDLEADQAKGAEEGVSDVEGAVDEGKINLEDAEETAEGAAEKAEETAEGAAEEAEEAADEAQQEIPGLDTLEGMVCNKRGYIINQETGKPVGELIEGDPKKLAKLGATLDDKGQFWDNRGNVIGKAKALPIEEEEENEGPFSGLEGLVVGEDGFVEDENSRRVGRLVEGDAKKLSGRGVDEDGEILDRRGNVIGRAERLEEEKEEEEAAPDWSAVNGLSCNKAGYVIGPDGYPIARVVEGNPKALAGKKIEDGEIYDGKQVVGRVELIPEDELDSRPEGPFAGMESLIVTKDGFVEDEDGTIVGKLVEGDAKKLRGRAVDEDGEITDKYGNVKGRAEPYEVPEEEAPAEEDLSLLEGKVVNKFGNVIDPATGAVVGRVVEGDKRLAGCKVDGKGQIWGDNGKVVGRAELIPGAEQQKAEGPFYGFENAVVGKDGVILDGEQIIGRLIEGDAKRLLGRKVDEDGDVLDKNGNTIGKAERWEPEEKKRDVNPMSGRKVNKEGEVRDADGNLIGKLTSGNLANLVGKLIDDNGYVIDNDGNKIGECTLLENIEPEEEEGLTAEEQEAAEKAEHDRQLAEKMISILTQTLDRIKPVCKQIEEVSPSPILTSFFERPLLIHPPGLRKSRPNPQGGARRRKSRPNRQATPRRRRPHPARMQWRDPRT